MACEVAASSGGLLLGHLATDTHAVAILLGSYVLWGVSVLPAFAILTILMLRLVLHKLPEKELATSAVGWLWDRSVRGLSLACIDFKIKQAPYSLVGDRYWVKWASFQICRISVVFILLGFGLWWLGIAVMTTLHHAKQELPFNLGWWGLTFPIGRICTGNLNLSPATQFGLPVCCGLCFCSHPDVVMEFGRNQNGTGFLSRSFVLFAVLKNLFRTAV